MTEKGKSKELDKVLNEVVTGEKIFHVEGYGDVKVVFPSVQDTNRAEYEYGKAYNQAVFKDGYPTNEQVERMIRENGWWTEEDDKKLEELDAEIANHIAALNKMTSEKSKKPIRDKLELLQKERAKLRAKRDSYFSHTAENIADQARLGYLIWACSFDANTGERIWKTYEDFKQERNQKMVGEIGTNLLTFLLGIDDSLLFAPPQASDEGLEGEEMNDMEQGE